MVDLMYSAKHYQAKCAKSEEACKEYAEKAKEYADNAVELTSNKADTDLSNVDDNIDYVVKSYNDGTNWYRVYKSGWCEQGGGFGAAFSSWGSRTVNFLKPFKDKSYYVNAIAGHTAQTDSPCINSKTTTSFSCTMYNSTGNSCWEAKGYIGE